MTVALPINIDSLLRRRTIESERVEYKAGWNPESVLHTLGAFANDFHNLGGGYVVLGVEERNGRPVLPPKGLDPDAIDGIQKEMLNLGNSAIQPPYHPLTAVHEIDGKTILILYAPGGETRPYRTRSQPLGRQPRVGLLHPQAQQHGTGARRGRARVARIGRDRAVRRPLPPRTRR